MPWGGARVRSRARVGARVGGRVRVGANLGGAQVDAMGRRVPEAARPRGQHVSDEGDGVLLVRGRVRARDRARVGARVRAGVGLGWGLG